MSGSGLSSPLCSLRQSERSRDSTQSLVQLNYSESFQPRSLPATPALPSHEGSTNNPAEASGSECPKTGPGIASGRPLRAEKHPRGWGQAGRAGGLCQEQQHPLGSPVPGQGWDGVSGDDLPALRIHGITERSGLEGTLKTPSFHPVPWAGAPLLGWNVLLKGSVMLSSPRAFVALGFRAFPIWKLFLRSFSEACAQPEVIVFALG